jgi:hypothetical protein
MTPAEKPAPFTPSASECILDNFEPTDRIAILVLNRQLGDTTQRIATAQKASSAEFQAWLRYKNANIPLTEAERNAVEDGVNAFENLLAQLTDVPTPAGPISRQLQSGLVQIDSTQEGREWCQRNGLTSKA